MKANDILSGFTGEETLTILEAARVAMTDADVFNMLADKMDIADDELARLREKLTERMS
jgi:hypothetical protein